MRRVSAAPVSWQSVAGGGAGAGFCAVRAKRVKAPTSVRVMSNSSGLAVSVKKPCQGAADYRSVKPNAVGRRILGQTFMSNSYLSRGTVGLAAGLMAAVALMAPLDARQ